MLLPMLNAGVGLLLLKSKRSLDNEFQVYVSPEYYKLLMRLDNEFIIKMK
jgi:hypothetical protein